MWTDEKDARAFNSAFSAARTIAIAVLGTLPLYAFLVEILRSRPDFYRSGASVGGHPVWRFGIYAAAATSVVLGRLIHKGLLNKSGRGDQAAGARLLLRASVFAMAFSEVPAVLGLGLFLLGGSSRDFYNLLLVSAVLGFIYVPRRASWESRLRNEGGGCPF
jgi:hypothetical protein